MVSVVLLQHHACYTLHISRVFAIKLSQYQPKNLAYQPHQKYLYHVVAHKELKMMNPVLSLGKGMDAAELDSLFLTTG
jgi:hypothetical protein